MRVSPNPAFGRKVPGDLPLEHLKTGKILIVEIRAALEPGGPAQ